MENIRKEDLIKYTYYDENHNHVALLNKEYLLMILKVDKLILNEDEDVG